MKFFVTFTALFCFGRLQYVYTSTRKYIFTFVSFRLFVYKDAFHFGKYVSAFAVFSLHQEN